MHVFVADIHIRPGVIEDSHRFVTWLTRVKEQASQIYVLGDLFDYWYSGIESRAGAVLEALGSPQIHLMAGNRDFLIRNSRTGPIHIIHEEEHYLSLFDRKVLIAHGHTLTDADRGFRVLHRYGWPLLAYMDRRLPAGIKERCARFLVKTSRAIRPPVARIDPAIALKRGVNTVICGHLHRPFLSSGLIVLPPFFDTGQWLIWDEQGPRFSTETDEQ